MCLSFNHRDSYNNISALDPKKLKIFNTVREITGEKLTHTHMHKHTEILPKSIKKLQKLNLLRIQKKGLHAEILAIFYLLQVQK